MRLVCPNCEAKYEVPDDAIPDTGRDVQCANCGHAWFQMRPRPAGAAATEPVAVESDPAPAAEPEAPVAEAAAERASEPALEAADGVAPADPPEMTATVDRDAETPAAAETAAVRRDAADATGDAPEPAPDAETPAAAATGAALRAAADDPEEDPEPAPDAAAAPAYAVDDSVLAILREEAEREANARRAEAMALESQTDLGLDSAAAAKIPAARTPAARTPSTDPEAKPSARRDLLPDVEEINSTLRPSDAAQADGGEPLDAGIVAGPRRGFRSGFLTVMVVAIIGAAVYVAAPQIGRLIPALEGPLASFVGFVDGLRLGLDGMMRSATVAINGG
jgi:predicted Zn finger-like uncharacterized protein